jgi:hypothetical protein
MHQNIGAEIHLVFCHAKSNKKNPLSEPNLRIWRIVRQANVQFDALCGLRQQNIASVGIDWGIREGAVEIREPCISLAKRY